MGASLELPVLRANESSLPKGITEAFVLQYGPERLQIAYHSQLKGGKEAKERTVFACDWDDPVLQNRALQSSTKSPLIKAMGITGGALSSPLTLPTVLDATAGLGEDSFLMGQFASRVTMIERSPILFALLEDGLRRAKISTSPFTREVASRMVLHKECIDACTLMDSLVEMHPTAHPDIIFLDPMHDEKFTKSALPKFKIQLARLVLMQTLPGVLTLAQTAGWPRR